MMGQSGNRASEITNENAEPSKRLQIAMSTPARSSILRGTVIKYTALQ